MAPSRRALIPPERQSARIRQQSSSQSQQSNQPAPLDATTYSRQSTRNKVLQTIPGGDFGPEDDNEDDDDGEASSDDDGVTFKTKTKLPTPVVTKWTLGDLLGIVDTEWLELDPAYQREVVWSLSGMTGLVNSLFEEYYIPPIIFNLKVLEIREGYEYYQRICVDGKQRITSCHLFMKGDIPCLDKYGKKWWYTDQMDENGRPIRKAKRRILSEDMKRTFREKEFVCYEYKDLTPIQEEDLFARVQKGVQLLPAEKMRASTGPWQELAKRFETDFRSVVDLSLNKRAAGFRNLLNSFAQVMEVQYPSRADGQPQYKMAHATISNLCKNGTLCTESIKSHLAMVFQTFDDLVVMERSVFENNNWKHSRNFAPIEMAAVACLISKYQDTRNHDLLLGDIKAMRHQVREAVADIRNDSITWKTFWQFIDELESYRGLPDGSQGATKKTMLPGARLARGPVVQVEPIRGQIAVPQGLDPYQRSRTTTTGSSNPSTRSPTDQSLNTRAPTTSSRTSNEHESAYPPHPRAGLRDVYAQSNMPYGPAPDVHATTSGIPTVKTEELDPAQTIKRRASGFDPGARGSTAAALAAKRYKPSG